MSTTPKLDELIDRWADGVMRDAYREIREHLQRIPAQASDYDEPSKEAEEFMLAQGRKDMGYPSEAETRLIELCAETITSLRKLACNDLANVYAEDLAAIKRDLGLPPSP
jgi:hypothetical protein